MLQSRSNQIQYESSHCSLKFIRRTHETEVWCGACVNIETLLLLRTRLADIFYDNMKIGTAYGRALQHTHVIFLDPSREILFFSWSKTNLCPNFGRWFFQLMVKWRKLNYVRMPCFVARNDSGFVYTL